MHTQTETVHDDRPTIIPDPLKDSVSCSNANSSSIVNGEEKERDTVSDRQQRYERKKRIQCDNNGYHNSSPRRHNNGGTRFNRLPNHQNGSNNRQTSNRNNVQQHNYVNNSKSHHLDNNNNGSSTNNQSQQQPPPPQHQKQNIGNFGYKTQNEYQDNKKQQQPQQLVQKQRYVAKGTQSTNYDQTAYNGKPLRTENGGGDGESIKPHSGSADVQTRKYSTDFLKHVGQQYNMNTILAAAPVMKNQMLIDESNLLAIKLAFGDNAHIYNSLGQQQQQYQQSFMRYQQQQLQQRMQLYHRHEQGNYQRNLLHQNSSNHRGYNGNSNSNNSNSSNGSSKESSESTRHHAQQQSQDNRSYHNSYYQQSMHQQQQQQQQQNTLPFQNRGKHNNGSNNAGNREQYRKNRNHTNGSTGDGGHDRLYNNARKLSNGSRLTGIKSENNIQDDLFKRKNLKYIRANSDEQHNYRSLSPTPPSSVKSVSPGLPDKSNELKESSEIADDSVSTASASSGPSALSCSSDTGGKEMHPLTPPPILLTTTTDHDASKEKSVDTWINSNNFGVLHNGLSASAEQLNTRSSLDAPVSIIKRPPSVNEISVNHHIQHQHHHHNHHHHHHHHQKNKHNYSAPRHFIMPAYDPAYPFEYYLSRSDQSEMRIEPNNLKCGSVWDVLSKQMWDKFQLFQQTRETYRSKMILWRELYDYIKEFPFFQQRAFPKWGLFLVGSTISGFGLDSSDVDMCLVLKSNPQLDPRTEAMITLNTLRTFLTNSGSTLQGFSLINAKVPILRFRDVTKKIEADLNYNNCIGV